MGNIKFHYCILSYVRVVRKSGLMRSFSGSFFCILHEKHVFLFLLLLFCGAKYMRIERHEFVGFM